MKLTARIRDDQRGAGYLAAFIVLFSLLGTAGVGILIDGARIVSAERQCTSIALEAARAGANALEPTAARNGDILVDPAAAQAAAYTAAAGFVSGSGASLQSVTVNGNRVTVRVSATVESWFPIISSRTVTQQVSADAVEGVSAASGP